LNLATHLLASAEFHPQNRKPTCQFNFWRWVTWNRQSLLVR
jgi:hypothetical protein